GKAEFISAAVEGALIFVAGLLIIYESVVHLIRPRALHQLDIGIIVIAISGVVNFIAGVYAVRTGRKNKSLVVESAGRHLQSDAYSTLAIVIGLVLLLLTGWAWLDSAVALVFAAFIMYTGYKVVRKSLSGI